MPMKIPSAEDRAPAFTLQDAGKSKVKLTDHKGRWVVLYFYPRDNTPGCTLEALDFSALKLEFEKLDAVVLGISRDSCESHQRFIDKKGLTITLLSDPDAKVQKKYGAWGKKKFMGKESEGTIRTTLLIAPSGHIEARWDNVRVKGHAEQVLSILKRAISM